MPLLKIAKLPLIAVIPIITITLYLMLMIGEFLAESAEIQRQVTDRQIDEIEQNLLRMKYIVESSLLLQDRERINQEVALAATDLNTLVYCLLAEDGTIIYSNYLVWRDSQAETLVNGFEVKRHRRAINDQSPYIFFNDKRNSVHAYYPLDTESGSASSKPPELIYLEYDMNHMLGERVQSLLTRSVKLFGIGVLVLMVLMLFIYFTLLKPIRLLRRWPNCPDKRLPVKHWMWGLSGLEEILNYLEQSSRKSELERRNLASHHERWRFVVELWKNGAWEFNLTTGDVFLSERWKMMRGELVTAVADTFESVEASMHEEDKDKILESIQKCREGQVTEFDCVHRFMQQNGAHIWVRNRGMVVDWDYHGQPTRLLGCVSELSADAVHRALGS